jgi:hypothetical protein
MIAFGIDLAGYSTGKTSLAAIEVNERFASAVILRKSALSQKRDGTANADEALAADTAIVRRCLAIGPVAVDIPIDLQGLPDDIAVDTVWSLTYRPIDRALNAMPPLADRIGAPVVRFRWIMRHGNFEHLLGTSLFEAYPAATLRQLSIKVQQYKGKSNSIGLGNLCDELKFSSHVKSDDDIDAIICAIAAAAPSDALFDAASLNVKGELPRGFRIPKSVAFDGIDVKEADFDVWMSSHDPR